MSKRSFAALYRTLSGFIALCLLSADLVGAAALVEFQLPQPLPAPVTLPPAEEQVLFRTTVTLRQPRDLARVRAMGAVVLEAGEASALLLVTAVQLEDLARLRFEPTGTDELGSLAAANAATMPWLAESLAPALATAAAAQQTYAAARAGLPATDGGATASSAPSLAQPAAALAEVLAGLSAEQLAAVGEAISPDYDGDGLTDTQEAWWCTDSAVQDSDADGTGDGQEISVLIDWMANRRSGPPNQTPWSAWPPLQPDCPDKDQDSIPNLAERWSIGTSMDLESTDRDRYDDGQELFGTTYCPGSANGCGYGVLPSANHDGVVLFPQMPAWVTAPGNHPSIAALPKLAFALVTNSSGAEFKVQTATVITVDERHEEGTTKTYATTKTEGTSSSDTSTETWENWQEYTKTTEASSSPLQAQNNYNVSVQQRLQTTNVTNTNVTSISATQKNYYAATKPSYLENKQTQAADFILNEACNEFNCRKYASAGIRASVRTFTDVVLGTRLGTSDKIQNEFKKNNCDPTSFDPRQIWCRAKSGGTLWKANFDERIDDATKAEQEARGMTGGDYLETGNSHLDFSRVYPIEFPAPRFIPTESNTTGSSTGGARSTTTTQYTEHAVTESTANQFGRSWGTATAEDSVHAADLWFAYTIENTGDDYARQICDLAINVYIGDMTAPAATYYPGNDLGGDGCFANFRPGESHRFSFPSQSRIQLTLDQLRTIDQGGPVRFEFEDYSLGQDDYYADDAVQGGMTISIDDGTDDGDPLFNTYIIPTWGDETVYDVLTRYFPNETDAEGDLTALWTPEYRGDTPGWCAEPLVVGVGAQRTLWCKHALSTTEWWNIYTSGLSGEGFETSVASQGAIGLFRFNQDSDQDGYSDRSEDTLGTDRNDPLDYPNSGLLAAVHSLTNSGHVTATLSLLNTGRRDIHGIEAVLIAPDDSLTVANNTVGGAGRVRAASGHVVGSQLLLPTPLPVPWRNVGHARPVVSGYYSGTADRTYTFTVNCTGPCSVGLGNWSLTWSSGSQNGTLNFGAGYHSPTTLAVGSHGLQLGMLSGTVANGESLTVQAKAPRDTFQYTINHEPPTPPLVIVSYNDPQGHHRFLIPPEAMNLGSPADSLMPFAGQMILGPSVEIATSAPHQVGANTTDLTVNNSSGVTIEDAYLFLEFVDSEGVVALEVPTRRDLPPGPTTVPIAWNTNAFTPAYQANQDYIFMAFWTDYQGNIIDTAARPLSSFQDDPTATLAFDNADLTWDFGTAAQGTLLQRRIVLGSTGYQSLLTHIGGATGVSVTAPAESTLGPADMGIYTLQINTADLAVGPFSATIPIRTSDARVQCVLEQPRSADGRHAQRAGARLPEQGRPGAADRPTDDRRQQPAALRAPARRALCRRLSEAGCRPGQLRQRDRRRRRGRRRQRRMDLERRLSEHADDD